jgi:hypothetical protein
VNELRALGYLDRLDELLAPAHTRLVLIVTGSRVAPWELWSPAVYGVFERIANLCDHPDGRRGDFRCGCIRVVHGNAKGIDKEADAIAYRRDWPIRRFPVVPSVWMKRGGYAGHERNHAMVDEAKATAEKLRARLLCTAFIHNGSPGATGCAGYAQLSGIPTLRVTTEDLWMPRVTAA